MRQKAATHFHGLAIQTGINSLGLTPQALCFAPASQVSCAKPRKNINPFGGSLYQPPEIDKAALTNAPPPSDLSAEERNAYDQLAFFYTHGLTYALEMGNHPQTLFGIADSPIGLAAWILDHDIRSYELITRVFEGKSEGLTRDDILDNITLYWLTKTAISTSRLYWENKFNFFSPKNVKIPVAVSAFPDELYAAPRSWVERAYPNLIHYNKHEKGGHFAAWEQPQLLSGDVREAFRSLR